MLRLLITILCALFVGTLFVQSFQVVQSMASSMTYVPQDTVVAQHAMPLDDRYANAGVNHVFKENILLALGYLSGNIHTVSDINWDKLNRDFEFAVVLKPGEVFAFHDAVLPVYQGKHITTTKAHFTVQEGFLSDGLAGDGVCHLASLVNWAARDAGLQVEAPTNHDFAKIPDVPRQYGTAIYTSPDNPSASALQNLYITNNKDKPIKFVFQYTKGSVVVKVEEVR